MANLINSSAVAQEAHITSLIVRARPERIKEISTALSTMPDTEVHTADDNGKFVVLLETSSLHAVTERVDAISRLPGAINVTLVYHQIEDAALLDQPVALQDPQV